MSREESMSEETVKRNESADKLRNKRMNVVAPLTGDDAQQIDNVDESVLPDAKQSVIAATCVTQCSTERDNVERERMRLAEERKHHEELGS